MPPPGWAAGGCGEPVGGGGVGRLEGNLGTLQGHQHTQDIVRQP